MMQDDELEPLLRRALKTVAVDEPPSGFDRVVILAGRTRTRPRIPWAIVSLLIAAFCVACVSLILLVPELSTVRQQLMGWLD